MLDKLKKEPQVVGWRIKWRKRGKMEKWSSGKMKNQVRYGTKKYEGENISSY